LWTGKKIKTLFPVSSIKNKVEAKNHLSHVKKKGELIDRKSLGCKSVAIHNGENQNLNVNVGSERRPSLQLTTRHTELNICVIKKWTKEVEAEKSNRKKGDLALGVENEGKENQEFWEIRKTRIDPFRWVWYPRKSDRPGQ